MNSIVQIQCKYSGTASSEEGTDALFRKHSDKNQITTHGCQDDYDKRFVRFHLFSVRRPFAYPSAVLFQFYSFYIISSIDL